MNKQINQNNEIRIIFYLFFYSNPQNINSNDLESSCLEKKKKKWTASNIFNS